jgi:hypothetical protein
MGKRTYDDDDPEGVLSPKFLAAIVGITLLMLWLRSCVGV